MAAPSIRTLHRAVVEHLVRQAVYQRLGKPLPRTATAPNPLVVNISARHCHLTPEAVEALFGKGHQLHRPQVALSGRAVRREGNRHARSARAAG